MEPVRQGPHPEQGSNSAKLPDALRLVARREHSLLSLMELSHELTLSLDLYSTADFALFNVMGQLGTSRSGLWLTGQEQNVPVLLRAHGIRKQVAVAIGNTFGPEVAALAAGADEPMRTADILPRLDSAAARLAEEAGIAIFAPIFARARLFGFLALGHRVGGEPYGDVDMQVLRAALGMLGVTLENTRLYNHLLEQTRRLRLANENLQELDRLKSEFLRNVNHELRTPLTIIIAYVNMLHDQPLEPQHRQFVETMMEESLKLKDLVENLLDFSAVSEDTVEIDVREGDLRLLVQDLHTERKPGVAETLHELHLSPGPSLPLARFDPQRVRQILDVLIDNAVKFTPKGSKVTLRLEPETDENGGGWVRVDVEDDGPGIPREKLAGIFESFRQVDGSTTRSVGGMGMGLALARKFTAKMNGRLEATSRTGLGTRLSLFLPVASPSGPDSGHLE